MTATSFVCPKCDFENTVLYERDTGEYKVAEVWLDNDDNGLACVGCRKELDADALYEAASMDAAGA